MRNEGREARDGSSSSPCRGDGLRHAGRRPRPCSHFLSVPFDSWVLSPPVIHPLICANPPCSREDTGQVEGERAAPGRRRKATAPHSCSLPERNKGRGTSQVEEPDPSSLALHVSGSTVAGGPNSLARLRRPPCSAGVPQAVRSSSCSGARLRHGRAHQRLCRTRDGARDRHGNLHCFWPIRRRAVSVVFWG